MAASSSSAIDYEFVKNELVNYQNLIIVLIVALGFLAGLEVARAFSFWKW